MNMHLKLYKCDTLIMSYIKSALVQEMAWCLQAAMPFFEPMMTESSAITAVINKFSLLKLILIFLQNCSQLLLVSVKSV